MPAPRRWVVGAVWKALVLLGMEADPTIGAWEAGGERTDEPGGESKVLPPDLALWSDGAEAELRVLRREGSKGAAPTCHPPGTVLWGEGAGVGAGCCPDSLMAVKAEEL